MMDIPEPLEIEIVLDADLETVWNAWTTEEGIRSFFAPACRIEPHVGGAYEVYFDPDEAKGSRGAEGTTVLAIERSIRLSAYTPRRLGKR